MEIADYIVAEDRRLVELVLEGDDRAFEYLFNRYRDAIHRLFVQRLGGVNDADDLLWQGGTGKWFRGKHIHNPNTHGTGCTLSSAIASNLAKGYDLETAVRRAKAYISGALAAMLDLGHGSGPMNHAFALDNEWSKEAEA